MNAVLKTQGISATRIFDVKLIQDIMLRIGPAIAEDGYDFDNWQPDMERSAWIHIDIQGQSIGLFQLTQSNTITLEIHANLRPDMRQHKYGAGRAVLRWIYNETSGVQKVNAQVPVIFPNVKQYTLNMGFTEEGLNRKSYLKDGEVIDQHILGITRDEIEAML